MASQGSRRRGFLPMVRASLAVFLAIAGCDRPPPVVRPTSKFVVTASAAPRAAPSAVPVPPRSPFAYANIDPDDDLVVGPPEVRSTCEQDLAAAGVAFYRAELPVHVQKKSKITCGAPQAVIYRGSPSRIAYQPSVMLTCTMALALARFETVLQKEALEQFGKRVVKIHHLGTYSCREMAAYPGWVSEHSYANAIDLQDFVLEDGRTVDVYKDFAPKAAIGKTAQAMFLRAITQRAFEEEIFSSVLTPFFDAHHANHFHLDLARFRSDGSHFVSQRGRDEKIESHVRSGPASA